jgi:ABC-type lipoprotein export system ATPase subunit
MSNEVGNGTPEPILAAVNVHRTFIMGTTRLEVLRGVSLTVSTGEFLALRGASGAGKSTLLHLLGGLDMPDEGDIVFAGQTLGRLSNRALTQLRNTRIGFVFQAYHLLPELSALENVVLPARMARKPVDASLERARQLLARVGLEKRLEHRPSELSGGEQQRVALARALINEPVLLLADEPTGNLDSRTGGEIFQLLCDLRAEGNVTLVIATHDSKLAERAQRVIELEDGGVCAQLPMSTVVAPA